MPTETNRLWLTAAPASQVQSHFQLREFANDDGLAMVHPALLAGLENLRARLCSHFNQEVAIKILDAIRTRHDLYQLARRLGWADQGGAVSRTSRHLTEYGGIAADITAYLTASRTTINPQTLAQLAADYFDFVKGDYEDGHVHVDQRDRAAGAARFYP